MGWQASVYPGASSGQCQSSLGAVYAVKPPRGEKEPAEIADSPTQPGEGLAAREDGRTLQWEMRSARQTLEPGFVNVQVNAPPKEV